MPKLSDARLAELEGRWKPVGNVVVSGAEFVALLAEVVDARAVERSQGSECPDCAAKIATRHAEGCDVARCSACGWQFIGDHECADPSPTVWMGEWPGLHECREFGILRPDGSEDLNKLASLAAAGRARWDTASELWRLRR